jgi:hypothetical protein
MALAPQKNLEISPWFLIAGKDGLSLKLRQGLVVGEDQQRLLKINARERDERWLKLVPGGDCLLVEVLRDDIAANWETGETSIVDGCLAVAPGTVIVLPNNELYVSNEMMRGGPRARLVLEWQQLGQEFVQELGQELDQEQGSEDEIVVGEIAPEETTEVEPEDDSTYFDHLKRALEEKRRTVGGDGVDAHERAQPSNAGLAGNAPREPTTLLQRVAVPTAEPSKPQPARRAAPIDDDHIPTLTRIAPADAVSASARTKARRRSSQQSTATSGGQGRPARPTAEGDGKKPPAASVKGRSAAGVAIEHQDKAPHGSKAGRERARGEPVRGEPVRGGPVRGKVQPASQPQPKLRRVQEKERAEVAAARTPYRAARARRRTIRRSVAVGSIVAALTVAFLYWEEIARIPVWVSTELGVGEIPIAQDSRTAPGELLPAAELPAAELPAAELPAAELPVAQLPAVELSAIEARVVAASTVAAPRATLEGDGGLHGGSSAGATTDVRAVPRQPNVAALAQEAPTEVAVVDLPADAGVEASSVGAERETPVDPELIGHLRRARDYIDRGLITSPSSGNAVAELRGALSRSPANQEAGALMDAAAAKLVVAAREAQAAGLDFEARNLLEEVLGFRPGHPEAVRLREAWMRPQ